MKSEEYAKRLADECKNVARRYVEQHGWKRGLYLFGRAIGGGERRARAIYSGEARRIEAHEYLLAREADIELRRLQRAALMARLDEINRTLGDEPHGATGCMGEREVVAHHGATG